MNRLPSGTCVRVWLFDRRVELSYKLAEEATAGDLLVVPIRRRVTIGRLVAPCEDRTKIEFELREAVPLELVVGRELSSFAMELSRIYGQSSWPGINRILSSVRVLLGEKKRKIKALQKSAEEKRLYRPEVMEAAAAAEDSLRAMLTEPQLRALESLEDKTVNLLHGPTGSGKSYVYAAKIAETLAGGRSVIVLFPEISMATAMADRFRREFGIPPITELHSLSNESDRDQILASFLGETPIVIFGVHLPVFAPVFDLGLVIVDEEHEQGYVEHPYPKFNSVELALLRAKRAGCGVILSSATPSVTSYHNARSSEGWKYVRMLGRYKPRRLKVFVEKFKGYPKRKTDWIGERLRREIEISLAIGKQTILFVGRRGYAHFARCDRCGAIQRCPVCDVALRPHGSPPSRIECHYCGRSFDINAPCLECGSGRIRKFSGVGTEQVTEAVKELFPDAAVQRVDLDTNKEQKNWPEIVEKMNASEIDILVGTKLVTKGYHFPGVATVGIIMAEQLLTGGSFAATEQGVQQIVQVLGRASDGVAVIQTFGAIESGFDVSEERYPAFLEEELSNRSELRYPPFRRICRVDVISKSEAKAAAYSSMLAERLRLELRSERVVGPTRPPVRRPYGRETFVIHIATGNIIRVSAAVERFKNKEPPPREVKVEFVIANRGIW